MQANRCDFTCEVTADYNNRLCSFTLDMVSEANEDLIFTVVSPSAISGISGKLTEEGGKIIFDDIALQFPLTADDLPSPISAPWLLMNTLRSGFLSSACMEDSNIRLSMDDTYNGEPLRLDIWLNDQQYPEAADILYDGKRILTMRVSNFGIS